MAKSSRATDQKATDAIHVFKTRVEHDELTDRELKLVIGTLRKMLLDRQQVRATTRYLKATQ